MARGSSVLHVARLAEAEGTSPTTLFLVNLQPHSDGRRHRVLALICSGWPAMPLPTTVSDNRTVRMNFAKQVNLLPECTNCPTDNRDLLLLIQLAVEEDARAAVVFFRHEPRGGNCQ